MKNHEKFKIFNLFYRILLIDGQLHSSVYFTHEHKIRNFLIIFHQHWHDWHFYVDLYIDKNLVNVQKQSVKWAREWIKKLLKILYKIEERRGRSWSILSFCRKYKHFAMKKYVSTIHIMLTLKFIIRRLTHFHFTLPLSHLYLVCIFLYHFMCPILRLCNGF